MEAAVRSSERPVRCRPRQPEAVSTHLLAEVLVIEAGLVSFPALAAGVGWFGLIRGDGAHFVTQGSPSELPDALAGFPFCRGVGGTSRRTEWRASAEPVGGVAARY